MPSGSHGGHIGGGGSRGGGFRGGGGSHIGGGGGFRRGPSRPLVFLFFGRRYYIPVQQSNSIRAVFMLAFVLFVFALCFIAPICITNQEMGNLKVQQEYYIDMIENAERNPEYKRLGVITDKFYYEEYGKWYVTYSLPTDSGENLDGYTFCVYDSTEIRAFVIGDPIYLAVNSRVVTKDTDSITFDYKDISIKRDGRYINANKRKFFFIVLEGIVDCGLVASVIAGTVMIIKKAKLSNSGIDSDSSDASGQSVSSAAPSKRCKYCGSSLNSSVSKCPNCGATLD